MLFEQGIDFPGGKIAYTTEMNFLPGSSKTRVECYRILDEDGYQVSSNMLKHVTSSINSLVLIK